MPITEPDRAVILAAGLGSQLTSESLKEAESREKIRLSKGACRPVSGAAPLGSPYSES